MSEPLSSLRGMARGAPQVTRCQWCGEYTRKPCQCPAEVEIERLRAIIDAAPVAIMDTRDALGLCAPTEAAFPALYALRGHRVALVDLGSPLGEDKKS